MVWNEPSLDSPFLSLPCLRDETLCIIDASLAIEVDDAFMTVWKSGTDMASPETMASDLCVLLDSFARLAAHGQGKTQVSQKRNVYDLVTQVDQGIELLFRFWIRRHYPDHKVIGEEFEQDVIEPGDMVWYIDPIDGTANFVSGDPNVCLMVGGVRSGVPIFGYLNLFNFNTRYLAYEGSSTVFKRVGQQDSTIQIRLSPSLTIGVEYMPESDKEELIFDEVFDSIYSPAPQLKSIGCNLVQIIEGRYSSFYKPIVKLWDIIPGLCILRLGSSQFDYSMLYPIYDETMSPDTVQETSPFSVDEGYLDRVNTKHRLNGRIGLITVTPISRPDIKLHIQSIVLSLDSRMDYKS